MEPKVSLPHSQEPPTCPYPDPNQSNPCLTIPFFKIHCNSILLSMPRSSKRSLFLRFLHQNPVCIPPFSHTCYMSIPLHSSLLTSSIYGLNIFIRTLFLYMTSLCSSLHVRDQVKLGISQSSLQLFDLHLINICSVVILSKCNFICVKPLFHMACSLLM